MQYDAYTQLIQKLDDFIRKFYLNRIIKGTLISVGLLMAAYLLIVLLEHYYFTSSNSSTTFRTVLTGLASLAGLFTTTSLVLIPVFNYFKLGKLISKQEAAKIIGDHFSEVEDKLLNVLQLKDSLNSNSELALVSASIEQKAQALKLVPFTSAIDLSKNKRYIRFILPPVLLFLLVLFSSNMIGDSTHRLLNMNKDFKRDAAFQFLIPQNRFEVVQYDDLTIEIGVEGRSIPSEVFIELDNYRYKLQKKTANTFTYTFTEVRKDQPFRLYASSIFSEDCLVDVIEKPSVVGFDIALDYPSYTDINDEVLAGTADLTIPEGTLVKWQLNTVFTNDVLFQFDAEEKKQIDQKSDQSFSFEKRLMESGGYHIFLSNNQLGYADSMSYIIQVVKDKYPSIEMKALSDSTQIDMRYFGGSVNDDYGVRELNFIYSVIRDNQVIRADQTSIALASKKQSTFSHVFDLSSINLSTGDRLEYYFEVWDNDAINGSKSTRSAMMTYKMPTLDELKQNESTNNEEIKSELEEALKKMKELGKDVQKVKNKILQKKELNWQDKREIENLMKNREEIEEEINKANENFKENLENQEKFQQISEELMEKQEKLSEMFDEMMNEEMKELFEQMEKLLEELSQEEMKEQLDEIDFSEDEMEKELDRMLELFKKMEVEKNMEDIVNELDSLAKEEEKEADLNASDQNESDSSATKQEELNEKFEEIMEKYEETQKKNAELENPFDMENEPLDNLEQEVQENQQDASQNLQKGDKKNASKSQKNASKKMKEMSKGMQSMMQMNKMEEMEQDLKAMRQLLEDLVMLSFDQEDILQQTHGSNVGSPTYLKNAKRQGNIKTDFRIVEDSLQALAKRVIQLQSFINEKVTDVKRNLDRSIESLEDRQKSMALVQQQFAMTGINDIALMLSESMDQMQQSMADQMPGQQMCEKPGGQGEGGQPGMGKGKNGQKPGFEGLKKMQEQLNDQIQQLKDQLKNGKNPGNKHSKDFAKMAAKQAAIRKRIQEMKNENQKQGKGGSKEIQELIDQMDKIEEDLVNKRLPNDMLKRQRDILTRLLEAENAERERDKKEEREAERAEEVKRNLPPELEEYLRDRKKQVEMFKTVSPILKPYYRKLVEQYFRSLN